MRDGGTKALRDGGVAAKRRSDEGGATEGGLSRRGWGREFVGGDKWWMVMVYSWNKRGANSWRLRRQVCHSWPVAGDM
jgi:hypothetical protein